jgi:hypothetical protein
MITDRECYFSQMSVSTRECCTTEAEAPAGVPQSIIELSVGPPPLVPRGGYKHIYLPDKRILPLYP